MSGADSAETGRDDRVAVYFAGGAGDGTFDHVERAAVDTGHLKKDGATYHPTTREVLSREGTWAIWEYDGPADAP